HAQGPVQRERVAAGTLLALGCQHVNLAQIGERRGEGREPGGVDAVVVGDEQDGHSADQELRILLPRSHPGFDRLGRRRSSGTEEGWKREDQGLVGPSPRDDGPSPRPSSKSYSHGGERRSFTALLVRRCRETSSDGARACEYSAECFI